MSVPVLHVLHEDGSCTCGCPHTARLTPSGQMAEDEQFLRALVDAAYHGASVAREELRAALCRLAAGAQRAETAEREAREASQSCTNLAERGNYWKARAEQSEADNAALLERMQRTRDTVHSAFAGTADDRMRAIDRESEAALAAKHPGAALLKDHERSLASARNEGLEKAAEYMDANGMWAPESERGEHAARIRAMKESESCHERSSFADVCKSGGATTMPNPWRQIDELASRHRAELSRARAAVSEAKAAGFKVLETGIWKCRFRPYKSGPVDVRAHSGPELVQKLELLTKERVAAKEAARKAREEQRRKHREAVATTRAELKKLGARGFRIRRDLDAPRGAFRWKCWFRHRRTDTVTDFDEPSAAGLLAAVRRAAEAHHG